ncbi:MAG: aminotransferase class IV [Proteobacteria bacterium]|nr:aminotransferase class IV [Pseudomonadota bacterium]
MTVPTPDWDQLGFAYQATEAYYLATGERQAAPSWAAGGLVPADQPLALAPSAAVLSYACGIFEGLKAERARDGRLLLFRPQDHAERFRRSAERLQLLPLPPERFVEAVRAVVRANERFVPPAGRGTFYLRPLEHGIAPMLGLGLGSQYQFVVYGSPVGDYHAPQALERGLRLRVLPFSRVAPGGTGAAKAMGNYPGGLVHKEQAQREGFADVLYTLVPPSGGPALLQECSGANVFCLLRSGTLITPATDDTVLAGVTRASVLTLAAAWGLEVAERALTLEELLADGAECFCTGTAWTVRSVAALGLADGRVHDCGPPALAPKLRAALRAIQSGDETDRWGWTLSL